VCIGFGLEGLGARKQQAVHSGRPFDDENVVSGLNTILDEIAYSDSHIERVLA
jgi:threonine dehydratase